jgi:hypothetical protein
MIEVNRRLYLDEETGEKSHKYNTWQDMLGNIIFAVKNASEL